MAKRVVRSGLVRRRLGRKPSVCSAVKSVKRTVCTPSGTQGKVVCRKKDVKVCVRSASPLKKHRRIIRRI